MEHLDLAPIARAEGSIVLPAPKSISNRTLLLAALAEGVTEVLGLLDSDDVTVMLAALDQLGVRIQRHGDSRDFTVSGVAGPFPVKSGNFFLGNAGTAFRPLTAALALSGGDYQLSGVPRMHERPIGDLIDALRGLGAKGPTTGNPGYPPLTLSPAQGSGADQVAVRGDVQPVSHRLC